MLGTEAANVHWQSKRSVNRIWKIWAAEKLIGFVRCKEDGQRSSSVIGKKCAKSDATAHAKHRFTLGKG